MLEAVRDMSDWNNRRRSLPKGTGMGVAFQFAHAGYVAYVVELTVDAKKAVSVSARGARWTSAGRSSTPASRKPGAWRLHRRHEPLMTWEITIEKGRVVQSNFHQYQPTRMAQAPAEIQVRFLETDFDPTGLGEPSLPPAMPAIANAIFAATGERIRSLPLAKHGYRWA